MQIKSWQKINLGIWLVCAALLVPRGMVRAQGKGPAANGEGKDSPQKDDTENVAALLRQLKGQIDTLNAQVGELKKQQQSTAAETADLRNELNLAKSQLAAMDKAARPVETAAVQPTPATRESSTEDRINRLEENQQLADSKIAEQSQTKVESGSKYRVRLSGIVLFNMFGNSGNVDNLDYPQLAVPADLLASSGSFGASLRQSQIGIEAYGPTIAGARTSANVQFDFAGGFPEESNGVSFGIMRLRTGTIRFDWADTSVVAGQDVLFFAPLSPTSYATLATPALAYAGNLWAWTPQVRVEHRFHFADSSSLLVQGGILDSLSGDVPPGVPYRYPSWGESSSQPAYAARVALNHKFFGQDAVFGIGGYYGRQDWGFGRGTDGWSGMADVTVPLGEKFAFTGAFYRGRAVGGLGGGIGQSVLWNGPLIDPETEIYGLNSIGGWAQLKYKATSKLQFNGAFGQDNPFAGELRENGGNQNFYGAPLTKNQSGFVNFIYQPRSDIVLSLEYRKIRTYILDNGSNSANVVNFSVGYIF
jgi:regulator of replication initiation timing